LALANLAAEVNFKRLRKEIAAELNFKRFSKGKKKLRKEIAAEQNFKRFSMEKKSGPGRKLLQSKILKGSAWKKSETL
jgi:hypothetical protein